MFVLLLLLTCQGCGQDAFDGQTAGSMKQAVIIAESTATRGLSLRVLLVVRTSKHFPLPVLMSDQPAQALG